jgi:hypothetical protein
MQPDPKNLASLMTAGTAIERLTPGLYTAVRRLMEYCNTLLGRPVFAAHLRGG